ncbi:hypothetical protein C2G38_2196153 [Gigaspora rosea]|uniref:Protein kinase domain-containing protein n=1 Tax=Gigaspora rosea TaxID=44941 RepID=A0A397UV11_9GLOM|nr:hypothetical protein C2G38_2196153 [Gigaspora rosea]
MGIALRGSSQQNLVEVSQLEWRDKLNIVSSIAFDLGSIHSQELIPKYLYSRNILKKEDALRQANVTDLGLSKKRGLNVLVLQNLYQISWSCMGNDPDKRSTAATFANKAAHWLDKINQQL